MPLAHSGSPALRRPSAKGRKPGHSVVRLRSGGDRLTFAGDAVFPAGFDRPDWHNGFEHDPEEAARVRVRLLRELAATGEQLVATRLPFPSVARTSCKRLPPTSYPLGACNPMIYPCTARLCPAGKIQLRI